MRLDPQQISTHTANSSVALFVTGQPGIFQDCIIQQLQQLILDSHLELLGCSCISQMKIPRAEDGAAEGEEAMSANQGSITSGLQGSHPITRVCSSNADWHGSMQAFHAVSIAPIISSRDSMEP